MYIVALAALRVSRAGQRRCAAFAVLRRLPVLPALLLFLPVRTGSPRPRRGGVSCVIFDGHHDLNPCPHAHRPSACAAGLSHARSHLPDRPTRPKRATRPARGHSSSVCPPFTTDLAAPVNPSAAPRPRPPAGPVDLRVGERRIRCPPLAAALSPQPPPPEQSSPTVQNERALKRPCPSGRSTAPPRQVSRHQGSFGGLGSVVLGLVVAQPSSTGAQ